MTQRYYQTPFLSVVSLPILEHAYWPDGSIREMRGMEKGQKGFGAADLREISIREQVQNQLQKIPLHLQRNIMTPA